MIRLPRSIIVIRLLLLLLLTAFKDKLLLV